jgi:secreted trypsin-like serine protease
VARIAIEFAPDHPPADYIVQVSTHSRGGDVTVNLKDDGGAALPLKGSDGNPAPIRSKPGATYYLESVISAEAANAGGCCSAQQETVADVEMRVRKAPILYAAYKHAPYIAGGTVTTAYPTVGVILIDGRVHCTATVVGPHTVLTAAHCLHGYEKEIKEFKFGLGFNYLQPTAEFEVTGWDYPKDAASGFRYNPKTFEDDIGVVYVSVPVGVVVEQLHNGQPRWEDVAKQQLPLLFVGFGYNVIGNQKVGQGIKREAAWPISEVENRKVRFKVQGKNTCSGDSGGPAFIEHANRLVLAAVTSGGDLACTEGFDTRVDALRPWVDTRIR